jgi:hypothetical protein
MSRETAKTELEANIASLNSSKNWYKGVSGTYSVVSQPNSSDFGADRTTLSLSDWTGTGRTGWLTAWKTANSSVTKDDSHSFPADTADYSHTDYLQHYFVRHEDMGSDFADDHKVITDIDAQITALQTDLDDINAAIAAGEEDLGS